MPKVNFVKAARKDVPGSNIKAGESYYWWKFRYGGKHVSRTRPRPSQLTQSEFLGTLYEIQERIEDASADEDLPSLIEEIAGELNDLAQEQRDKKDNMPEGLQEGDTGQLLESRADAMESAANDLESLDTEIPDDDDLLANDGYEDSKQLEDEPDEEYEERKAEEREQRLEELRQEFWDNLLSELQGVSIDSE